MNQKVSQTKIKRVTIDELAIMVNNGFKSLQNDLGSRIDMLSSRVDMLETKMDQGFKKVQSQIDKITHNYVTMQEHRSLENRVKKIGQQSS